MRDKPSKFRLLSSVIERAIEAQGPVNEAKIAEYFGYKSIDFVRRWRTGEAAPPLNLLPKLAYILDCPHEDLLIPWLCDTDPENLGRYTAIAWLLRSEEYAIDLLSGARANSKRPWWSL